MSFLCAGVYWLILRVLVTFPKSIVTFLNFMILETCHMHFNEQFPCIFCHLYKSIWKIDILSGLIWQFCGDFPLPSTSPLLCLYFILGIQQWALLYLTSLFPFLPLSTFCSLQSVQWNNPNPFSLIAHLLLSDLQVCH